MHPLVNHSSFLLKTASSIDPNVLAALQGGAVGAGAGALIQGVRKLLQSRQDEQQNGSPSILKGMLLGGGLGAAGGYGLRNMLEQAQARQDQRQRDSSGIGELTEGIGHNLHPDSLEGAMNGQHGSPGPIPSGINPAQFTDRFANPQMNNMMDRELSMLPGPAAMHRFQVHQDPSRFMPNPPQLQGVDANLTGYHPAMPMLAGGPPAF